MPPRKRAAVREPADLSATRPLPEPTGTVKAWRCTDCSHAHDSHARETSRCSAAWCPCTHTQSHVTANGVPYDRDVFPVRR